jgi:hypothetical protein
LHLGQGLWLDQQALSLVAAAVLAESNDDSVSRAFAFAGASAMHFHTAGTRDR